MQGTSTPQERDGYVPGECCSVLPPSRTATGWGPLSTGECPAHVISHFPERPSPAGSTSCVPSQAPTDMSAAGLPDPPSGPSPPSAYGNLIFHLLQGHLGFPSPSSDVSISLNPPIFTPGKSDSLPQHTRESRATLPKSSLEPETCGNPKMNWQVFAEAMSSPPPWS